MTLRVCMLAIFVLSTAYAADAAYVTTNDPWGSTTNDAHMNAVFGLGQWDKLTHAAAAGVLNNYQFLFIEGGDGQTSNFTNFMNANRGALEAFVAGGGKLFLNAARWSLRSDLDLGFGATLVYGLSGNATPAVAPAHPIITGPFGYSGVAWTGTYFSHDFIVGGNDTLLVDHQNRPVLAETVHGAGVVWFGGMTTTNFHNPNPDVDILRQNILAYMANFITDTTPPVITLLGDNPMRVDIGAGYTEPGYTASDDVDGNITADVVVTGYVPGYRGTFTLTYEVADAAGNVTAATRTVRVDFDRIPVTGNITSFLKYAQVISLNRAHARAAIGFENQGYYPGTAKLRKLAGTIHDRAHRNRQLPKEVRRVRQGRRTNVWADYNSNGNLVWGDSLWHYFAETKYPTPADEAARTKRWRKWDWVDRSGTRTAPKNMQLMQPVILTDDLGAPDTYDVVFGVTGPGQGVTIKANSRVTVWDKDGKVLVNDRNVVNDFRNPAGIQVPVTVPEGGRARWRIADRQVTFLAPETEAN